MTAKNLRREQRVQEAYEARHLAVARRTDTLFVYLFVFQWIVAVSFSLLISPTAWSGDRASVHVHVYAAIFLGGLLSAFPLYLILTRPGATLNRMVIAASQISYSILFIHLTGGRIETHFHIFGSLAFLAFYRDWRPIAIGTVVTAMDHLFRGAFWPESVYGVLLAGPWRALEHSAWVLFEDGVLLYSTILGVKELRSMAESQIQLEDAVVSVEDIVIARTRELMDSQRLLTEQQQSLAKSAKMSALGEMAGGVAHEINNPLAVIQILSGQMREVLDDRDLDRKMVKEMAEKIELTTKRIARIVNGLRTFSRDGSKDPFQAVNVKQLVDETLSFCLERFRFHGVEVATSAFDERLTFHGRAVEISQVLLNLLINAHDAIAARKEKWIRISVEETERDVLIRVTDCGDGIPASVREKIFQPFFTTKEIGKGTGLGLSLSQGMVRNHGGEIRVDESCANTSFLVRLPKRAEKSHVA